MTIEDLKDMLPKLGTLRLAVYQTQGNGPSSTKIVYLNVGLVFTYGWLLMVAAFCGRYIGWGTADGTFAAAISILSPIVIGFATSAHKAKNQAQADAAAKKDGQP